MARLNSTTPTAVRPLSAFTTCSRSGTTRRSISAGVTTSSNSDNRMNAITTRVIHAARRSNRVAASCGICIDPSRSVNSRHATQAPCRMGR